MKLLRAASVFTLLAGAVVLPASSASAATLAFTPTADTSVAADAPTSTAAGTLGTLRVDDTPKISYFRFTVSGVGTAAVTDADLTFKTSGTQPTGITLSLHRVTGGTWDEATTSYNNRPTIGAAIDTAAVPAAGGTAFTFDNVPGITGDGTYDFALTRTTAAADNAVQSSEVTNAANRPLLTLTTGSTPPPANNPPTVSAGPDLAVILPASASLDGTVTDDGTAPPTQTWSTVSGPGTVTFAAPTATDTTASFSAPGSYVLRLTASDGTLTAADDVTVTVSSTPPPPSGSVRLPADSGAVFLASAPYNVVCDGVKDNTAAIKQAMTDFGANATNVSNRFATRTLFLPAGVCLVSDTLTPSVGGTVDRGNALKLQGSGQTATTIKLKDTATGYGSTTAPKYVVQLGIEPGLTLDNAAYANYVSDLTVDVGNGNPGAMGIRFAACNSGAIERVTIRGTTSGLRGLSTEKSGGAALALDVTIEGFAYGLRTDDQGPANDFVFKNLTLTGQRTAAIQNTGRSLTIEDLTVSGAPKVYESTTDRAALILTDATLTGPGSGTAFTAATGSFVHLRNVSATGWGNLLTTGTTNRFVGKTAIAEWSTSAYRRGNTSVAWTETTPVQSLNLPSPDAPRSTDYTLTDWVKANVTSGDANDDGPALQAAIDSGKKVVYIPWGDYDINSTVIVRGNVEAIELMGAKVGGTGKISVGATSSPFVEIRNSALSATLEHNSASAVTIRNMGPLGTAPGAVTDGPSATGDLFLENVGGRTTTLDRPIHVYGRHFGREGRAASYSGGATVRLLGENLEMHDGKSPFMTINGVTLEVLGGAADNLATGGSFNSTTGPALFDATGSTLSIVQTGVQDAPAVTGHLISDDAIETTSANTVTTTASGAYTRVIFPLYVSP